jgi:hypothetical protein
MCGRTLSTNQNPNGACSIHAEPPGKSGFQKDASEKNRLAQSLLVMI